VLHRQGALVGHSALAGQRIEDGDTPENATSEYTVILCAVSAQLLPLTTTLSHVVTCASCSAILAARNRATFSNGFSVGLAVGLGCGGRFGAFEFGMRCDCGFALVFGVELEVDDGMVRMGLL